MKKCFLTLLSYFLVLSLATCGQGQQGGSPGERDGVSDYGSPSERDGVSDYGPPSERDGASDTGEQNKKGTSAGSGAESGLTMLCGQTSFNKHFGTDSGFYYFTQYDGIGNGLAGYHLMYIDYATKKEVYLCSDSSCGHNTESCSSLFSGREFGIDCLVFAGRDCLYVLNRDYDTDGFSSVIMGSGPSASQVEGQSAELYRMGFDGSGRQRIYSFPRNTTLENIVFGDGEDFWFLTKNLSFDTANDIGYTTSTNRSLVKYDVSENKITDTIPLSFPDNLYHRVVGADGSYFILCAVEYPDGMTKEEAERLSEEDWKELFANGSTIFEKLDVNSREKQEICRFSNKTGLTASYAVIDGNLFFGDNENGGIVKVNLECGDRGRLSDRDQNLIVYVLKDSVCCFGADGALYFTDIKTGETHRSALANLSAGGCIQILADTDDQALVIYDYDGKANSDGSFSIYGRRFALIDKSDLYAGRANYQPIKMAGSGM